jgi:DegV family protein with EDD domain
MSFHLFADSASDLPIDFYQKDWITMIPLHVEIDNKDYEDLVTITPKEVFKAIHDGKLPKTSQASPDFLEKVFTDLAKKKEPGLYIAFSSELSGTYQTSLMIREQVKEEYPDLDLTIIDTHCASLGYGLIVKTAAEAIEREESKENILKEAHFYCQHMESLFTVEDLDYLAKGGRVSKASAFVGGLLNIKPLLHVEDGKLVPLEKLRGKKKLHKRIIEVMAERGVDFENQTVAISHGDDEETALEMKQLIEDQFHPADFYIHMIGAAVGSHSGPGTLAIFFLNKSPRSIY